MGPFPRFPSWSEVVFFSALLNQFWSATQSVIKTLVKFISISSYSSLSA